MTMGVLVRRIRREDLGTVCGLCSELGKLYPCEEYSHEMTREQLYAKSRSLNPKSPLEFLVAEMDGEVVGFIDYNIPGEFSRTPFRDALYIGELYVKPEYRKRGVGRALVREVIRHGEENKDAWGVCRILTNAGNKEFYEALGFTPVENPQTKIVPMWSHEYLL